MPSVPLASSCGTVISLICTRFAINCFRSTTRAGVPSSLNYLYFCTLKNMSRKHNAVTRVIHWITVAIVIAAFVLGPEDINEMNNPNLEWGVQVHETLGLLVLGLSVLRIFWMFFTEKPREIAMPRVMRIGSRAVQGVFYLLLLSVPASAILGIWLEGDSLALVQNTAWASPFNTHENLGEFLLDTPPALADVLIWLAGFHAAAALFHHYFLKDDVLKSMLPK